MSIITTSARVLLSLLLLSAHMTALPPISPNSAAARTQIPFDDEALAPRALPWHETWFTRGAISLIKRGADLIRKETRNPITLNPIPEPTVLPIGKFGQRIGPLSRTARDLVSQLKTALEKESVSADHARLIANAIVRMQPASLNRLASWNVITDKQIELLVRQEPLSDPDAKALAQSLELIERSYHSFTPIQQTYFLARLVPMDVIEKIQSDTFISISELAEAAERWGDFDTRIYRAKSVVEIISSIVGGDANAWDIVIRHGIDHAADFSYFAASLLPRIAPLLGGPSKSWKVLIRYGTQNSIVSAIHVTAKALFYQLKSVTLISEMSGLDIILIDKLLHAPDSLDHSEVQLAYDQLLTVPRVNSLAPETVMQAVDHSISIFGHRSTARRSNLHHSTPARSLTAPVRLRTLEKLNTNLIEETPPVKADGAIGKGSAVERIDKIKLELPDPSEMKAIRYGLNVLKSITERSTLTVSERIDLQDVVRHLQKLLRNEDGVSLGVFDAIVSGPENYLVGFGQRHRVGLSRQMIREIGDNPYQMAEYLYHEGKASLSGETPDEHMDRVKGIQRRLFGDINELKDAIRKVIDENLNFEKQMGAARRLINYLIDVTSRDPDRVETPSVAVTNAILAYQNFYLGTTAPVITDSPDSLTAELLSHVAEYRQSKKHGPNPAAVAHCQLVARAFFLPDLSVVVGHEKSEQSLITHLALFLLQDTSPSASDPIDKISNAEVIYNQTNEERTAWKKLFDTLNGKFSAFGHADMASVGKHFVETLDGEWALNKYDLRIPDETPVAEVAVDAFSLKALGRLIDEMNRNSAAVAHAIETLQKSPKQYSIDRFSVNSLWDNDHFTLEDKLRYNIGLLNVTDSDVRAVLDFWTQLVHKTPAQRKAILSAAQHINAQYRRAVTWTLMRRFPNVKAFQVYRGVDAPLYTDTSRRFISAGPSHFSVSREIAAGFAGSTGQVLQVVVPLESIIDTNLDEKEDQEVVVDGGVYPMQPKTVRRARLGKYSKTLTSAA